MTFYGTSTLLFDDGTTQLLIDAFITRPDRATVLRSLQTGEPLLATDPATVDAWLATVIRTNRDTLYSSVVIDVSGGASLHLPEASGRYQSAMVVDRDHYLGEFFDRPGDHELDAGAYASDHVVVAVRTLVNPEDPADVATVARLQDELVVTTTSAAPFEHRAPHRARDVREPGIPNGAPGISC